MWGILQPILCVMCNDGRRHVYRLDVKQDLTERFMENTQKVPVCSKRQVLKNREIKSSSNLLTQTSRRYVYKRFWSSVPLALKCK